TRNLKNMNLKRDRGESEMEMESLLINVKRLCLRPQRIQLEKKCEICEESIGKECKSCDRNYCKECKSACSWCGECESCCDGCKCAECGEDTCGAREDLIRCEGCDIGVCEECVYMDEGWRYGYCGDCMER
ncbi:MAG: hypothetical protein PHG66_06875, partial [Candidatus Colwellbacteria bacterium]|nr:hypothetical protein [Candidatus Colwellbacteria bacterium]